VNNGGKIIVTSVLTDISSSVRVGVGKYRLELSWLYVAAISSYLEFFLAVRQTMRRGDFSPFITYAFN
jgi:hypothetical protein